MLINVIASIAAACAAPLAAEPPVTFSVTFPGSLRNEPATGRLIVYLIGQGSSITPGTPPSAGPFWNDLQPMFGADVAGLAPGQPAIVDGSAAASPAPLADLAPGTYTAQAVLDMHQLSSNWRFEPGNLFSELVTFTIEKDAPAARVDIPLSAAIPVREYPNQLTAGLELFEVRSQLLSDFRGHDVMLRAGIVPPVDRDPGRQYAAVYEVPGFGGDHAGAYQVAARRKRAQPASPASDLARNTFWIVLDPESGNGHTLFADSANNGPCGEALVKELIPALEAKYNLAPQPAARILRGHSSGGWSTLWLAITYPETFGACWSSSPDPVDFRRFQSVDIYAQRNMFENRSPNSDHARDFRPTANDIPSVRQNGNPIMTIREENGTEEVLGPDNTSGQQWDSWLAVFGPRNDRGRPAALYDPVTGALDKSIAEQYRKYDISERLRANPGTIGLIFQQRIRLVVGDQDDFYLNEAVALLKAEVEKLSFFHMPEGRNGYIKIVPGADHGSVFGSPDIQAFPAEMLDHLQRNGLVLTPESAPK
jgi:hypothetical protein